MTAPTEDEFEAWKADPTTAWVLEAYGIMAEAQREAWCEASWVGGQCDSYALAELRTRADAYKSMNECNLSDLVAAHDPEAE